MLAPVKSYTLLTPTKTISAPLTKLFSTILTQTTSKSQAIKLWSSRFRKTKSWRSLTVVSSTKYRRNRHKVNSRTLRERAPATSNRPIFCVRFLMMDWDIICWSIINRSWSFCYKIGLVPMSSHRSTLYSNFSTSRRATHILKMWCHNKILKMISLTLTKTVCSTVSKT